MIDNTPDTSPPDTPNGTEDPSGYAAICADDVQLRAFIVKHYGAAAFEIDGRIFAENLDVVYNWVKTGKKPTKADWTRRLKTISDKTPE